MENLASTTKNRNKHTRLTHWGRFLIASYAFTLPEPAPFQPAYNPNTPKNLVINGLNWFFAIMAFLCIAVIVWAGVTYATAGGDEDKVHKAKSRLIYAIIGIAVVISAYAIIQLIKSLAQGNTTFPSPTL